MLLLGFPALPLSDFALMIEAFLAREASFHAVLSFLCFSFSIAGSPLLFISRSFRAVMAIGYD